MRETAPFIWTETQPINFLAMLQPFGSGAPRQEHPNRWFLFRRTFSLGSVALSSEVNITVDGRYQAFVNGKRIGRGPARCSPLFQRYDTYDITPYLNVGENTLAVLIRVFGKDMSWYEKTEGLWNPVFGDGGLWVNATIKTHNENVSLCSDLDWRCLQSDAWDARTPEANHGLGFIESLDARLLPKAWKLPHFDDSDWDKVQIMQAGGGGPEAFLGGLTAKPFPHLVQNRLRPMVEHFLAPRRIFWIRETENLDDLAIEDQAYSEPLEALNACSAEGLDALLTDQAPALIATVPGRGVSILFDFEKLQTGYPLIEIDAKGGEVIDILVNEKLPDEWSSIGPAEDSRIARSPMFGLDAHMSRYTARPGRQVFERFEWQAIKWMQVTIRNADRGLVIHKLGVVQTHYPTEPTGSFSCSDPFLNKLWQTGRYTLQLCMHDGWEDCPSREQRQWLGDATVENLVGHAAFGPDIGTLNAEFIRKCAESQRPDGLTQMFAPGNHGTNRLLIPDWTLQWILNTHDHLRLTSDLETVEDVFPSIQKALSWFERSASASGLIADMAFWHFMDWSGVGRHGEAATLNAQLAGCYSAAADMAQALEMPRIAKKYHALAAMIQKQLNKRHWDEARGVYVDCVDPQTGQQEPRVSQHANAAMILWGDAPEDRWPRMLAWITDKSRVKFTAAPPIANTGDILDPQKDVVMANTFYSHFVFEAIAKAGRNDLLFDVIRRRYAPMIDAGATTLWESFAPTASLCHGFSASPTWQMSSKILGIERTGEATVRIKPDLIDLSFAAGTVAVKEGLISIQLKRVPDGTTCLIDGPAGLNFKLIPPQGHNCENQNDGTFTTQPIQIKFLKQT